VASLDRGIDAATDERRADGAAVERDREAVTRLPGNAETRPHRAAGERGVGPQPQAAFAAHLGAKQRRDVVGKTAEGGGDVVAILVLDRDRRRRDGRDTAGRRAERAMAGDRLVERESGENGRRPAGDGDRPEAEEASPTRDDRTPGMATYSYSKRLAHEPPVRPSTGQVEPLEVVAQEASPSEVTAVSSARRAGLAIHCRAACEDFGNAVMTSLRKGSSIRPASIVRRVNGVRDVARRRVFRPLGQCQSSPFRVDCHQGRATARDRRESPGQADERRCDGPELTESEVRVVPLPPRSG
jgi:hypothetical protein